jgi:hypothetical protein
MAISFKCHTKTSSQHKSWIWITTGQCKDFDSEMAIVISTTCTTTNSKDRLFSQESIKALVAIMGITDTSTIGIGPRLRRVTVRWAAFNDELLD